MLKGFTFWRCMLYISTQSIITKCDKGENHVIKRSHIIIYRETQVMRCLVKWRLARTESEKTRVTQLSLCRTAKKEWHFQSGSPKTSHPQAWPKDGLQQRQRKRCVHSGVLVPRPLLPSSVTEVQAHPGLSCHIGIPLGLLYWRLPPPLQAASTLTLPLTHRSEAGPPPPSRPHLRWTKGNGNSRRLSAPTAASCWQQRLPLHWGPPPTQSLSSTQAWHQVPVPITVTGLRMGILCLIIWFPRVFCFKCTVHIPGVLMSIWRKKLSVFQGSWADWVMIW